MHFTSQWSWIDKLPHKRTKYENAPRGAFLSFASSQKTVCSICSYAPHGAQVPQSLKPQLPAPGISLALHREHFFAKVSGEVWIDSSLVSYLVRHGLFP